MASEIHKILQCTAPKETKPTKLDTIANYMDSILTNMKREVKNSRKHQNSIQKSSPSGSAHHPKSPTLKPSEAINKNIKIMGSSKFKIASSKPGSATSSKKRSSTQNNNIVTKVVKKAHKKITPGKQNIKSTTCVPAPTHPTVVTIPVMPVVHHKSLKKSISHLNKPVGNTNIGSQNKIQTIIRQALTKVIPTPPHPPPNKKEHVEKKNQKTDMLRPMSVVETKNDVIINKRKTASLNIREQDTVNQQPKIKKKLLPSKSRPEIEPSSLIHPKTEELKQTSVKKSKTNFPINQEITVGAALVNNAGPSKNNYNIIMDAIPMTSEGKPIKFMKNNSDNKDQKGKPAQKVETSPVTVSPATNSKKDGGDTMLTINEKLKGIVDRIREERDVNTNVIKNCVLKKFGSPMLISPEQKQPVAVKSASNNNKNNTNNNKVTNNNTNNTNNNIVNDANKNANANNNNKQNVAKTDNNISKQNMCVKSEINNNKQNFVAKPEFYNKQLVVNTKQNVVITPEINMNKQLIAIPETNTNKKNSVVKIDNNKNDNMKLVVQSIPFVTTNKKISNVSCNLKQSLHSGVLNRKASSNLTAVPIPRKFSSATPMEIIQEYVVLVNRAKRDRKTYTVCGNYYSIRRAFIERGWLEKVRINVLEDKDQNYKKLEALSNFELVEQMRNGEHGEKCKRIFISKLLAGHQVDFYWDYQTNPFNVNSDKVKKTIINRFPFSATRSYTSKAGLCDSLKEAYWYYIEGYSNILFPRTYNLAFEEDLNLFIDDFRLTAAISLLSWVCKNAEKPLTIISPNGSIPVSVFNFATLQCYNFIKSKEHKDLDSTIAIARESEWDIFLEKFYKIIHQGQHFKESDLINAPLLLDQAKYILGKLKRYIPYLSTDGNMNLWLLKPNNGSRGCGIHVCRTLKYTLDTIHQRKDVKYVVQKYIGTKFYSKTVDSGLNAKMTQKYVQMF